MLFPWNLAPLRSSRVPLESLLLPPRSAPGPVPPGLSPRRLRHEPRALLLAAASCALPRRPCVGRRLERHPFSGPVHSAGELLHTPWRIPTSMATVLLSIWTDTFCGVSMSRPSGTVTRLSVHPASPVLLTKNGPLGTPAFRADLTQVDPRAAPLQSLRIGLGGFRPDASNHSLYQVQLRHHGSQLS